MIITSQYFHLCIKQHQNAKYNLITVQNTNNLYRAYDVKASIQMC